MPWHVLCARTKVTYSLSLWPPFLRARSGRGIGLSGCDPRTLNNIELCHLPSTYRAILKYYAGRFIIRLRSRPRLLFHQAPLSRLWSIIMPAHLANSRAGGLPGHTFRQLSQFFRTYTVRKSKFAGPHVLVIYRLPGRTHVDGPGALGMVERGWSMRMGLYNVL